jgi:hypothetical protein
MIKRFIKNRGVLNVIAKQDDVYTTHCSHGIYSHEWNIGLFAHFDTDCDEKLIRDKRVLNLLADNRCRSILNKYAVHECMAVNKICTLLQNNWTRKHAENYLKEFYSNS